MVHKQPFAATGSKERMNSLLFDALWRPVIILLSRRESFSFCCIRGEGNLAMAEGSALFALGKFSVGTFWV